MSSHCQLCTGTCPYPLECCISALAPAIISPQLHHQVASCSAGLGLVFTFLILFLRSSHDVQFISGKLITQKFSFVQRF